MSKATYASETKAAESKPANRQDPLPSRDPDMSLGLSGLEVWVDRGNLNPLPTGFYHLMDARAAEFIFGQMNREDSGEAPPDNDTGPQKPWGERLDLIEFVAVIIKNSSPDKTRRLIVRCYIEGLSDEAVETIEIPPGRWVVVHLKPTLKHERVERLEHTQQFLLHVVLENSKGVLEGHKTFRMTCLPRNSAVFELHGGDRKVDLTWCYGAWVTPHEDRVQEQIVRALDGININGMPGYQQPNLVDHQVWALFRSLQVLGVKYVNTILNYGFPEGEGIGYCQRVRLPCESLEQRSANCMDATLLLASLLEGVTLNPAIILVPGHAMLGWERCPNPNRNVSPEQDWGNWRVFEATSISVPNMPFEKALEMGSMRFNYFQDQDRQNGTQKVKVWSLKDLRRRGVWPLE